MAKSISQVESPAQDVRLDEKDLMILKLLQENARMPVKEIGARINLSATPVHERIRRMENAGVIRQYATVVDPVMVGKGLTVICYVSLKEHNRKAGAKFIQEINRMPEVLSCYNISGEFDFLLKVVSKDMNAYYDFHVNRLGMLENIGNMQSVFVMGVIKDSLNLIW